MHAIIEVTGPGDISIIDLGSTKGTFVNGQKVNKAKLQDGDSIVLGDIRIELAIGDASEDEVADQGEHAGQRRRAAAGSRRRRPPPLAPPPPPAPPSSPPPIRHSPAPRRRRAIAPSAGRRRARASAARRPRRWRAPAFGARLGR